MNNRQFAEGMVVFRKACELANIRPTKRQAGKWRRRVGLAWGFKNEAIDILAKMAHEGAA